MKSPPCLLYTSPIRREGDARSIKNQAVVAADLIHVDDGHPAIFRHGAQHVVTQPALPQRVRRGRNIQDQRASLAHEFGHRIPVIEALGPETLVVPAILTDCDSKCVGAEFKRMLDRRGLKDVYKRQSRGRAR